MACNRRATSFYYRLSLNPDLKALIPSPGRTPAVEYFLKRKNSQASIWIPNHKWIESHDCLVLSIMYGTISVGIGKLGDSLVEVSDVR